MKHVFGIKFADVERDVSYMQNDVFDHINKAIRVAETLAIAYCKDKKNVEIRHNHFGDDSVTNKHVHMIVDQETGRMFAHYVVVQMDVR